MSGTVREYDHVGRYGGEEFLVVLPDCTAEAAREVAERVRQHIGDRPIVTAPTQVLITVSIGVCQWRSGQEIHDLLHRADSAMYRAKQNGRNRVEVDDAKLETLSEPLGDVDSSPQDRRRIRRSGFDRSLRVSTYHQGRPALVHGRIRDIGEFGMGVLIPRLLYLDEQVTLEFAMEGRHRYAVSAIVRHCEGFHHGFEFLSVEPSLREAIVRL
jgi:hypothetical protein